jgi:hypothetical protein
MERALERLVWQRADGRCEYCQVPQVFDVLPFQIDHVIAVKHEGQTIESNLALSCYNCNLHKGPNIAGFDPVSQTVVRLFHPRSDVWSDHFQQRNAEVIGATSIGRATVQVLRMNDPVRVALRLALIAEGS